MRWPPVISGDEEGSGKAPGSWLIFRGSQSLTPDPYFSLFACLWEQVGKHWPSVWVGLLICV